MDWTLPELDRSKFRAWLEGGDRGEAAGVRMKASLCPIAKYLQHGECLELLDQVPP